MNERKKGFTLIELLIVIAIIALLATAVVLILNPVRILKSARDTQRISDIAQLQKALELFNYNYGRYPLSGECGATVPNGGWSNSIECLSGGSWVRDSAYNLSQYFSADPVDPFNDVNVFPTGSAYYYFSRGYGGDGQWYMIIYHLETPDPKIEEMDGVTAPDGTYFHYGNGADGIVTVGKGR